MGRHYTIPVELAKGLLKYAPRVISAEQKILRGVGYSHKASKGISHGLLAGSVVGNLLGMQEGSLTDGTEIQSGYGTPTGKPDKARGRFQRSAYRRQSNRFCNCRRKRRPFSRSNYSSRYS